MRKSQPLISQAGGLLALVCFFLPWVSCLDEKHSGVEIGGYAWISGSLLRVEYGSIGTLAGFVMALYGSLFLNDDP